MSIDSAGLIGALAAAVVPQVSVTSENPSRPGGRAALRIWRGAAGAVWRGSLPLPGAAVSRSAGLGPARRAGGCP
jgi:hypothetical protein